jgi:hypothetical protein
MAILKKSQIPAPVLPTEAVEVPELGGEVIVRGLLLKDRLALYLDNENGHANLSKLLAATVRDGDGLPVFNVDEWEVFGTSNFGAVVKLFNVARRLSGLDAEVAEKN